MASSTHEMTATNRHDGRTTTPEPSAEEVTARNLHDKEDLADEVSFDLLLLAARLIENPDILIAPIPNSVKFNFNPRLATDALRDEHKGRLHALTKQGVIILATCVAAGAAQGIAQESIVGANQHWPVHFNITTMENEGLNKLEWKDSGLEKFSLVNSTPYLAAGLLGAFLCDPLTYHFGRRGALFVAGICSLLAPIGAALTQKWYQLLICRLIQGIGIGFKASTMLVIMAESFPHQLRARLSVFWQASVALGIFIGAITNIIFHNDWRLQMGICSVWAIPLLLLCYIIPESPRWLVKEQRFREAYKSLVLLRKTELQAARDLILFDREDQNAIKSDSWIKRWIGLFKEPYNRRTVLAVSSAMFAQQCSGINLFAFLATTIIQPSSIDPIDNTKTLSVNIGFGGTNFLFSALTFYFVECRGKNHVHLSYRSLLLISLFCMIPLLAVTGHFMDMKTPSLGSVTALILVYTAVYSFGAGVVPFPYAAEAFPQAYREVGMSFACMVNFLCAFVLAMAVPQFTKPESGSTELPARVYKNLFGVFSGLSLLSWLLVFLFLRIPRPHASLRDYEITWKAPTSEFFRYKWAVNVIRGGKMEFNEWIDKSSHD